MPQSAGAFLASKDTRDNYPLLPTILSSPSSPFPSLILPPLSLPHYLSFPLPLLSLPSPVLSLGVGHCQSVNLMSTEHVLKERGCAATVASCFQHYYCIVKYTDIRKLNAI